MPNGDNQNERIQKIEKSIADIARQITDSSLQSTERFTLEDWVLCGFTLMVIVGIGSYFWFSQQRQENLFVSRDSLFLISKPDGQKQFIFGENEDSMSIVMKSNAVLSEQYINYANKALMSSATRKNTGFLVGNLLVLMGCVIVFRRIREMPATVEMAATSQASLKLLSSSPGVIIVILGSAIILATILHSDTIDFSSGELRVQPSSNNRNTKDANQRISDVMDNEMKQIDKEGENKNANVK